MGIDVQFDSENNENIDIEYNFTYNNCIDLFSENIKDITLIGKSIFFSIDNDIYIFDPYNFDNRNIELNFSSTRPLLILKNRVIGDIKYIYHQLVFPFCIDDLKLCENFIYFVSNGYHNILFHKIVSKEDHKIEWVHFLSEIKFTVSDIHISSETSSLLIKINDIVYKYYKKTNNLEKYLEHDDVYFVENIRGNEIMFCKINESVYTNQFVNIGILCDIYQGKYYKEVINVFSISSMKTQNVIIIKGNDKKMMFIEDKQFYLNMDKIICSGHEINKYVVFCSENIIYYIFSKELPKKIKVF
ncbi:KilA-N domain-containing protein [Moumouvirus goulette]|uniref:KilA-N domain-containing protein n=1 Tax=Moumouvirus goulette TaxID=1247379 RepID=M1PWX6_9VIRU|nr:KilA-N domain-containing protein [Moumouvirus goulette]AGF85262.1 KilA-N domain-containing protein [Moumouvirus goulette]